MYPTIITDRQREAAASEVRAYRSDHTIEPMFPRDTIEFENWCLTCGIKVYPIKNGWRHDHAEIGAQINVAGTTLAGWPR